MASFFDGSDGARGGNTNLSHGSCVISIDFGTSRSAFAYTFIGTNSDKVTGCPKDSLLSNAHSKAETCIILDESNSPKGFGSKGRQVYTKLNEDEIVAGRPPKFFIFQYFKMFLKTLSTDYDDVMISDISNKKQLDLLTVISKALRYVADSALTQINTTRECNITIEEINWVITVPAIWSDAANGFMRRAAKKAGLIDTPLSPKLMLVREPEAACIDLLIDVENGRYGNTMFDVGQQYAVLDCGGGTDDISYIEIQSVYPVVVRELHTPSGSDGGSLRINKYLFELLDVLFGRCNDDPNISRLSRLKCLSDFILFDNEFENWKLMFTGGEGDADKEFQTTLNNLIEVYNDTYPADELTIATITNNLNGYNASLPQEQQVTLRRARLVIPGSCARTWFDSVINVILNDLKVGLQFADCQSIQYLLLVGGFCINEYLYQRIQSFVASDTSLASRNINVIRASKPDISIVRGAVSAFERLGSGGSSVTLFSSHKSKFYYGIITRKTFDSSKHDSTKAKTDAEGTKYIQIFDIHVCQGDDVPTGTVTESKAYVPTYSYQTEVSFELMKMELPEGHTKLPKSAVIYADDSRLRKLICAVAKVDRSIPKDERKFYCSLSFNSEVLPMIQNHQKRLLLEHELTTTMHS